MLSGYDLGGLLQLIFALKGKPARQYSVNRFLHSSSECPVEFETLPMKLKVGSNSLCDLIHNGHIPTGHLASVSPDVIFSKTCSSKGFSSFSMSIYPVVLLPK